MSRARGNGLGYPVRTRGRHQIQLCCIRLPMKATSLLKSQGKPFPQGPSCQSQGQATLVNGEPQKVRMVPVGRMRAGRVGLLAALTLWSTGESPKGVCRRVTRREGAVKINLSARSSEGSWQDLCEGHGLGRCCGNPRSKDHGLNVETRKH